jgi:hypothetical protein
MVGRLSTTSKVSHDAEVCALGSRCKLKHYGVSIRGDSGSISLLIIGLFTLLLILSIGLINLADTYLAKRELISLLEPAVQRAAQSIDLERYYSQVQGGERVPIECESAVYKARVEVSQLLLRDAEVTLKAVDCRNDELVVSVKSDTLPIVDFPIFHALGNGRISIEAEVGAQSTYDVR